MESPKLANAKANRYIYLGFVLFGFYHLFVQSDFGDASIFLGIALAFDPFDPTVTWKQRPIWQRAVLIIHLAIVAACFGMQIGLVDGVQQGFQDGWKGR